MFLVASVCNEFNNHSRDYFLQCFDTVGLVIWPVKIVPKMTYNVLSDMLSLYTTTILLALFALLIYCLTLIVMICNLMALLRSIGPSLLSGTDAWHCRNRDLFHLVCVWCTKRTKTSGKGRCIVHMWTRMQKCQRRWRSMTTTASIEHTWAKRSSGV